jgi:hypothetical protein
MQKNFTTAGKIIISAILSKKVCPIPKGFWDRAISLGGSKIVDKKEILHNCF